MVLLNNTLLTNYNYNLKTRIFIIVYQYDYISHQEIALYIAYSLDICPMNSIAVTVHPW